MYLAKPQSQQTIQSDYYELFTEVDVVDDMTGEVIGTKNQSIGSYSITQLEQEKQNYLNAIAEVDRKITAIKSMTE